MTTPTPPHITAVETDKGHRFVWVQERRGYYCACGAGLHSGMWQEVERTLNYKDGGCDCLLCRPCTRKEQP